MSRQIDFSEYKIVDQEDGDLVVEHDNGTQFTLSKGGAINTESASVSSDFNGVRWVLPSEGGSGIQAAADDLGGPGLIRLAPGTYDVDNNIDLYNGQAIVGSGMGSPNHDGVTVLNATTNLADKMITGAEGHVISDLQINMNNVGYSAIYLFVAKENLIERVYVKDAGERSGVNNSAGGILLRNSYGGGARDNVVRNCIVENAANVSIDCGAGGHIPERNRALFNHVLDQNNSGGFTHGISIENNKSGLLMGNTVKNPSGSETGLALNMNACEQSMAIGNHAQFMDTGLNIANGPAQGNQILGNTFKDCLDHGVIVQPSSDTGLEDNLISNNSFVRIGGGYKPFVLQIKNGGEAHITNNLFEDCSCPISISGDTKLVFSGNIVSGSNKNADVIEIANISNNIPIQFSNNFVDSESGRVNLGQSGQCTDNILLGQHSTNQGSSVSLPPDGQVVGNWLCGKVTGGNNAHIFGNKFEGFFGGSPNARLERNIGISPLTLSTTKVLGK